jgi:hypothetical protein
MVGSRHKFIKAVSAVSFVAILAGVLASWGGTGDYNAGVQAVSAAVNEWGQCLSSAGVNLGVALNKVTGTGGSDGGILLTLGSGDQFLVTHSFLGEHASPANPTARRHVRTGLWRDRNCQHGPA